MFEVDEFKIYCGDSCQITDKIVVSQPTIREIKDFGEKKYFSAVQTLTSVGADLKWQLDDLGIDYTAIEDYDLFIKVLSQMLSSRKELYTKLTSDDVNDETLAERARYSDEELADLLVNPLQLVLNIDLADYKTYVNKETNMVVLYDIKEDIVIDSLVYSKIVDAVRLIHGFKRNNKKPANETTKRILIEEARDNYYYDSQKPYKSYFKSLVSSLAARRHCMPSEVLDLKVGMFLDSIKRDAKVLEADLLLQGAYSGFASLKDVSKSRLDWSGDL